MSALRTWRRRLLRRLRFLFGPPRRLSRTVGRACALFFGAVRPHSPAVHIAALPEDLREDGRKLAELAAGSREALVDRMRETLLRDRCLDATTLTVAASGTRAPLLRVLGGVHASLARSPDADGGRPTEVLLWLQPPEQALDRNAAGRRPTR